MTTPPSLAQLADRVWKKIPELRPDDHYVLPPNRSMTKRLHHSCVIGWNMRDVEDGMDSQWIAPITEKHAHSLIISTCVKWLAERQGGSQRRELQIFEPQTATDNWCVGYVGELVQSSQDLPSALLLACEKQAETRHNDDDGA